MRIVLAIFSRNDKILLIEDTLKKMGHDVRTVYTDAYRMICSYYKKKMDKLGLKGSRIRYERNWKENLNKLVDEFSPDLVLFVNTPKDVMAPNDLAYVRDRCHTACWFVDGISERPEVLGYLPYFEKIFLFEECDVSYLENMGIKATYLPVGYSEAFSKLDNPRDTDIVFIGSPFANRLKILETVAKEAERRSWNLKIIGPFYDEKYPWKKIFFQRKWRHICKFLENRTVSPVEAALMYSCTKVCLNIHAERHKSPNPRSFEIMATESFLLMDEREYWGSLSNEDCATYATAADLLDKIGYYLENEELRVKIARHGYNTVTGKLSMRNMLQRIVTS